MKYALISGASGGLATCTIKYLLDNDYYVYALDINNSTLKHKNLFKFEVDITSEESVANVYQIICTKTSGLDLIMNFAGIVYIGSVIEEDIKKIKMIFEVNVCGMYNINKTFFPLINNNKGRYINISSEYGVLDAVPFHSFYTMSKHAIEIYNDTLRRELMKFNIKVIKIRPGAFKTNMQKNITHQFDDLLARTTYYKNNLLKMQHMMEVELKKASDCDKFLKVVKRAINKKHPKLVYIVHNSFKMKLLSMLPAVWQDYIFKWFFK